jgi:hypothetical protein
MGSCTTEAIEAPASNIERNAKPLKITLPSWVFVRYYGIFAAYSSSVTATGIAQLHAGGSLFIRSEVNAFHQIMNLIMKDSRIRGTLTQIFNLTY